MFLQFFLHSQITLSIIHCLIFCCVFLSVRALTPPAGTYIGFQIHSWNDIREWPAAFAKGMRDLKIDPYYMPQSFCKTQPYAPDDPRGCFVLTHDPPVPTEQYNTTEDVFNFLKNPNNLHYFQSKETIHIALCFKNEPQTVCVSNPEGDAWKSLVTDIFNKGQILMNSGKYNIEFILDGGATPSAHPCLKDLWRPWNSTWINFPLGAFNSNDPSEGYDRFQVYNSFANTAIVRLAASLNWGKFSKGKYPLQIWEPCDEEDFASFDEIYLSWAKNYSTYHEFNFAINIDPKQFMIYNAQNSKKAIHELLFPFGTTPKILVISDDSTNKNLHYVLTLYLSPSSINIQYGVSKLFINRWGYPQLQKNFVTGQLQNTNKWLNNIESVSTQRMTNSMGDISSLIFVSDSFGHFAFYSVNLKNWSSFSLLQQGTFFTESRISRQFTTSSFYSTAKIIHLAPSNQSTKSEVYVGQLFAQSSSECGLFLNLWFFKSPTTKPIQIGKGICVVPSISLSTASLALIMNTSHLFNSVTNTKQKFERCVVEGFVTLSDIFKQIHALYICLSLNEKNELLLTNRRNSPSQRFSIIIDVGNNTNIVLDPKSGVVLETHGEGYCYNTEDFNKRPTPKVCSSQPLTTPNILNYNIGYFHEWRDFLLNTSETKKYITSCNSQILHGTYDQGRNPSSDLFSFGSLTSTKKSPPFTSPPNFFLGLIAVHEGYRTTDIDTTTCGRPNIFVPNSENGGLVIDGVLF